MNDNIITDETQGKQPSDKLSPRTRRQVRQRIAGPKLCKICRTHVKDTPDNFLMHVTVVGGHKAKLCSRCMNIIRCSIPEDKVTDDGRRKKDYYKQ